MGQPASIIMQSNLKHVQHAKRISNILPILLSPKGIRGRAEMFPPTLVATDECTELDCRKDWDLEKKLLTILFNFRLDRTNDVGLGTRVIREVVINTSGFCFEKNKIKVVALCSKNKWIAHQGTNETDKVENKLNTELIRVCKHPCQSPGGSDNNFFSNITQLFMPQQW